MKNSLKKTLVASAIAGALLFPTVPALPAAAAPTDAAITQTQAQADLDRVESAIDSLESAEQLLPNSEYTQEIKDLLKTAFELRDSLETVIAGGVPTVDPATILPRVELVVQIADTIDTATSTLQNKVQQAHVELGFAVTKAVLRVINPGATVEQLKASKAELSEDLERVSGYADLTADDTATIYVKARLDKKIWETRTQRDKNILGKAPAPVYFELNKNISEAVGVWFDGSATVAEVDAAIADLDEAYATAEAGVK